MLRSRLRSSQRGWASINIGQPGKWLSMKNDSQQQKHDESPTKIKKSSPMVDLTIKVECNGCEIRTKSMKLPLLEFQETSRVNRRQRRSSTQCHNGGEAESCCLDDRIVTIKELGWEDWIISPKSFNRRKCHGECRKSHTGRNDHSSIMKLLATRNNNRLKRCCTPQRFEPLYILYRKEHRIVKQAIPNLIIAECGCA